MSDDTRPSAPVVEIIEYRDAVDDGPFGVVVPNDIRINGTSVLCSDDPVTVHEISTQPDGVVRVTLTLLARRVLIEQRERPYVSDHDGEPA